jgi:hypothetical protein
MDLFKACMTTLAETAPRLSVVVKVDYRPGSTGALRARVVSREAVGCNPDAPLVLTGRSQTIRTVHRQPKAADLRPTSFVKIYWDTNRAGLD